jgi:hypothetical protein
VLYYGKGKEEAMPEFPVEGKRIRLDATSVVNRVMEWGQDGSGKRFKTETQARHPDTGMPMYGVEVLHRRTNFGEDFTATVVVEVGAAEKPDPVPMTPVVFEGLEVSIFPNKAGGLQERWSAEAIADIQQRPGPKGDTTPSSESDSPGKDASSSAKSSSSSSRSSSAAA